MDQHDRTRLRAPKPGELEPNTPAHFLATCRGTCVSGRGLGVVFRRRRPMRVRWPADGVWMLDGAYQTPGSDVELREGNVVVYHPATAARDGDEVDDRPVDQTPAIGLFDQQGRFGPGAGPVAHLPGDETSLRERITAFRRAAGQA